MLTTLTDDIAVYSLLNGWRALASGQSYFKVPLLLEAVSSETYEKRALVSEGLWNGAESPAPALWFMCNLLFQSCHTAITQRQGSVSWCQTL